MELATIVIASLSVGLFTYHLLKRVKWGVKHYFTCTDKEGTKYEVYYKKQGIYEHVWWQKSPSNRKRDFVAELIESYAVKYFDKYSKLVDDMCEK